MNSKTNYFNISSVHDLTRVAIVATLYIVITLSLPEISFSTIQFRVAEILNLLALYNKRYVIAVPLGIAISNIASPLGVIDIAWGSLSTFMTMLVLYYVAKAIKSYNGKLVAGVLIVTFSMFTIALEQAVLNQSAFWATFWFNWMTIAFGEFIVMVPGAFFFWLLNSRVNLNRILD